MGFDSFNRKNTALTAFNREIAVLQALKKVVFTAFNRKIGGVNCVQLKY